MSAYNIQNRSTGTHADLWGGDSARDSAPGTHIVVYVLNRQPAGTPNQQWRIVPLPAGSNLYTIQNVSAGSYASVARPAEAKGIISDTNPMIWEIIAVRDPIGYFLVKVPSTDLAWTLNSNNELTQITLAKINIASIATQQWAVKAI
ncbi:hypothetical protein B0H14DRAFT_3141641 [Mycena olivaceomarginata]|nr:hypothetical protein B0H14DRAFT_3141641 [Mycena olivaceomarginata]